MAAFASARHVVMRVRARAGGRQAVQTGAASPYAVTPRRESDVREVSRAQARARAGTKYGTPRHAYQQRCAKEARGAKTGARRIDQLLSTIT